MQIYGRGRRSWDAEEQEEEINILLKKKEINKKTNKNIYRFIDLFYIYLILIKIHVHKMI